LRGKHNLEVEEEVPEDEIKQGLLKAVRRKKNLPMVKVA
jgi:hypothetical protein